MKARLPLVYSCSGCSSAAQTANAVAIRLDREGIAEMTCVAGVGADIPHFLRELKSGRRIIALDGCPLSCVRVSLERHGVVPDHHFEFSNHGVRRRKHEDFSPSDVARIAAMVGEVLSRGVAEPEAKFGDATGRI